MTVDLKKWKQRNAAERVKAALTRPKKDNTAERLRKQFSGAADKAVQALNVKGRHPWLKYGYTDEVVITAKLGSQVIAVTGDEAIALKPKDAVAFFKDVIEATNAGQLDRELLAASAKATPGKADQPEKKAAAVAEAAAPASSSAAPKREVTVDAKPSVAAAPVSLGRMPFSVGLKGER
ncbi:hypothetical protein G7077_02405 [Sphingomonas piscis]|uniref:Uncharacterized protein n=1 Tax=Sphingomonas piscis TaxID=2714943 RepID=A0A6G7YMG2_9SPHN|nr:hypothetical protein [Sphingomonas piscis]QIK77935.1 hypothetical protein G7077_02405 [Sphingomonas piscis]